MLLRVETEAGDVILRVLRADRLHHAHGYQVLRLGQRHSNAQRSIELVVVVFRFPRFATGLVGRHEEWCIVDDGGGRKSLLQRGRIDEWLEARSGLALRLGNVIELAAIEVE